tara:strand:+ start:225 stop:896 length:672 start_codon:yes stop_codon:yes gene_type:complete
MYILIIEDDSKLANYISNGLSQESHNVDVAHDGIEGLDFCFDSKYDVIIVDRMLPKLNGISVIKALRQNNIYTPVLILSSLGNVNDRIEGLTAGGDDYLTKPFIFGELLARLNALSRRPNINQIKNKLSAGNIKIYIQEHRVTKNNIDIRLLPREYKLLKYFIENKGFIQTKTMLLNKIWDINFNPGTNVVETHISRLRAKISPKPTEELIKTIHGIGYMIEK